LCSSAAKLVSIAPAGERYTMFSGAFLQCLKDGVSGGNHFLTFEDVGKRTQQIIREKFPNDAVRPELHVPDQHRGNVQAQLQPVPAALRSRRRSRRRSTRFLPALSRPPRTASTRFSTSS